MLGERCHVFADSSVTSLVERLSRPCHVLREGTTFRGCHVLVCTGTKRPSWGNWAPNPPQAAYEAHSAAEGMLAAPGGSVEGVEGSLEGEGV